ncbi:ATP-binding protein [Vibrio sp. Of14-4]|uniref:ATP-binding protein n=1 Tax=Vibrio sp. Of14-4 TaxID=2724878 RepID=UPI001EF30992|nr:ATP-binding protein [Vibrio sp. Of14-4]MCG7488383.1 ATP-binding protein [Vibrio sp. Of14-4]
MNIHIALMQCYSLIHLRLEQGFQYDDQDNRNFSFDEFSELCQARSCSSQYLSVRKIAICLALIPHLQPDAFEILMQPNEHTHRLYMEFGLVEIEGVVWATGQTLAFLLGENRVEHRQQVFQWLSGINESQAYDLFDLDLISEACPLMWQALILRPDVLNRYLLGGNAKLPIVVNNLASLLTTPLEWNALILPESVYADLDEIDLWLEHGSTLEKEWQLEGKLRPGFRALFYGPPGTGKTLTATLLGKRTERPVYRVDIGAVTSKYIGETEKNLEQVFSMAEKHNWLLFFDEADALYGQRVQTSGANDQFANQNVAYLLQRIESFSGIIILATNLQDNLDDAFFRRFETTVYFVKPDEKVRLALWKNALPDSDRVDPEISLLHLARDYELTGAEIINVVRYAALKACSKGSRWLLKGDIEAGIARVKRLQNGLDSNLARHSFF